MLTVVEMDWSYWGVCLNRGLAVRKSLSTVMHFLYENYLSDINQMCLPNNLLIKDTIIKRTGYSVTKYAADHGEY